ncbi:MAG: ParA family protein [Ruminococcaceae bacterium]|nr:ParA family protein [Oscillospiraceae bacterium]
MGKIISFSNQKGGVGKTTSAVNVAASLGILGYKALLIDLDPQGNATSGVGVAKKSLKSSIYDVLVNKSSASDAIIHTQYENLDLIATNIALAGAEYDLYQGNGAECVLKNALAPIKDQYDYIIIDCPPSLSMLTVNAMVASDGVIIPMQCEFYALEGLSQLTYTVNRIKSNFNSSLNITGILITMYNSRLLLSLQVMNELRKHYSDKLFSTQISRGVKVSEAPGFGCPVYYHDKRCKGANEYLAIAKELTTRI